jgi:circadian clock protein KaiC
MANQNTIVKTPTGIVGLDAALDGGIPEKNLVLIAGGAGVGKTTLSLQFLLNGARKGEKGFYLSTEQTEKDIEKQARNFGKDFNMLISSGMLKLHYIDILQDQEMFSPVFASIKEFKPKRIVMDSLSTFSEYFTINDFLKEMIFRRGALLNRQVTDKMIPVEISEKTIKKRMLAKLMAEIRKYNSTVFLITELPEKTENLSSDGVSEFLADGVIVLKSLSVGDSLSRTLEIKKMRYSNIKGGIKTYEITDNGIELDST